MIRTLLQEKWTTLVKIGTLSLGLIISLVLYAKIGFELSYENFYPDNDRIYKIRRIQTNPDEKKKEFSLIYQPMPECMRNDIQGVEDASLTASTIEEATILFQDKKYITRVLNVDDRFMPLFQIPVLSGDTRKMELPYQAFISRSTAQKIFGESEPIGQTIIYTQLNYKKIPIVIAGIFTDFPNNSSLRSDILLSIQTLFSEYGSAPGWMMNDNYCGYVKLENGFAISDIEASIPPMLGKYCDMNDSQIKDLVGEYYLDAITSLRTNNPDVRDRLFILGGLALTCLFVSGLNYMLMSLSIFAKRGRQIALYKINGATNRDIFFRCMGETFFLIMLSLCISLLVILAFKGLIGELIQTPLSALLSKQSIYASAGVILTLVCVTGLVPSYIYSRASPMLVFRLAATYKRSGRNLLLFAQFVFSFCLFCVLFIVLKQYNLIMNKDLGYQMKNMVYVNLSGVPKERLNLIKEEFKRYPNVDRVSICSNIPISGMNGDVVQASDKKENLFFYKLMAADKDFCETFHIQLTSGENFKTDGENPDKVIVNETFVRMLEQQNYPVSNPFQTIDGERQIMGVTKDFQLLSIYEQTMPLMIISIDPLEGHWLFSSYYLTLRLNDYSSGIMDEMNKNLEQLTGNDLLSFHLYKESWYDIYTDLRLFRNSVIASTSIIFLISMLGFLAYMEDEILLRRKEIAIRKVHGAMSRDILFIIVRDISYVIIPALVCGIVLSYFLLRNWLSQFTIQISLSWLLLSSVCGFFLLFLYACIFIRSLELAKENPVNSLIME